MVLRKVFEKLKSLWPEEEPPLDWTFPPPELPRKYPPLKPRSQQPPNPQPEGGSAGTASQPGAQQSQPCPPCPACPPCPPCPQKQETPQPLLGQLGAQGHQVPGQSQPGQGALQFLLPRQESKQGVRRVICPKCGSPGRLSIETRSSRKYIYVRHHKRKTCYIGPADGYVIGKQLPLPAQPTQP